MTTSEGNGVTRGDTRKESLLRKYEYGVKYSKDFTLEVLYVVVELTSAKTYGCGESRQPRQ